MPAISVSRSDVHICKKSPFAYSELLGLSRWRHLTSLLSFLLADTLTQDYNTDVQLAIGSHDDLINKRKSRQLINNRSHNLINNQKSWQLNKQRKSRRLNKQQKSQLNKQTTKVTTTVNKQPKAKLSYDNRLNKIKSLQTGELKSDTS